MKVEVPVGVVHPALIEPYRIRFTVEDEVVNDCEITFNAAHRGIERILEGIPVEKANTITERVCGICSHVHLWNSCRVSEMALEVGIPERASYIRVLTAELERIHSHLIFFGHAFEVLGHETFTYRAFALREPILEIFFRLSGNRVHHSVPIIGGVRPRCDITPELKSSMQETLTHLERKVSEFIERVLDDPLIAPRVSGTGVLSKDAALKYHAVGPTARASGIDFDWRKNIPEYRDFDFNVVVLKDGDNRARVASRGLEVLESFKIIRQILERIPDGPLFERKDFVFTNKVKESYLEAPRGEQYHSLAVDSEGRVRNYRIRTPTPTNLAAMEYACVGDHLTDAVLTIASCDPCLSCSNRALIVDSKSGKEKSITFEEINRTFSKK